jgi:hypothetical protein
MPATMPGTPATVSSTTALCPYLLAKNVSAINLKNLVIALANISLMQAPFEQLNLRSTYVIYFGKRLRQTINPLQQYASPPLCGFS